MPKPGTPPPSARWIWSNAEATSAQGAKLAFRKTFTLPVAAANAVLLATADNGGVVFLNGRRVTTTGEWQTPVTTLVTDVLRAGDNELLVVVTDAGGAAGLRLEVRARLADGADVTVATDDSWQWTTALPDDKGRYAKDQQPADWQPAAVATDQTVWAAGDSAFTELVAEGTATGPLPMVRAVLVKCTPLMAALGRPNRDQVVTSRPADLTTLEAIQLANEQGLYDQFGTGGARILADTGPDAATMTQWIFAAALSRPPTGGEMEAARAILGPTPTRESVADCLWAVVMLPEFQLIR